MKSTNLKCLLAATIILSLFKPVFTQTNTFPTTGSAGIGTTDPHPSSVLDMVSTSKGVLVPRMTKVQRDAIVSPATGLLIYQTNVNAGFFFYNGSSWTAISTQDANKDLSNLIAPTAVPVIIQPNADNSIDLGSTGFSWKDLYVDGIGYLNTAKVGNYVGTPQAGMIRYNGVDFQGYNGISWLKLNNDVGGGGGGANTDLSNLTTTAINVGLLPNSNNVYDLGSTAFSWKNVYAENGYYIKDFPAIQITDAVGGSILIGDTQSDGEIGSSNILIGERSGKNINDTTGSNIFIGADAGMQTVNGGSNLFLGRFAGYNNTSGHNNIYLGSGTGGQSISGYENVFVGDNAGDVNISGYGNVALGTSAMGGNTLIGGPTLGNDSMNVAIGLDAGLNVGGNRNIMIGHAAGYTLENDGNVFIGDNSGLTANTGWGNVFLGENSGKYVFDGYANTFLGSNAGYNGSASTSKYNVYIGTDAGINTTGAYNTFVGSKTGDSNTGNDYCVFMGYGADASGGSVDNGIAIGYNALVTSSNTIRIGNTSINKIGIGKNCGATNILEFQSTTAKLTTGGVWTNASDERIKNQKTELDKFEILDKITQLKIERWHYLADEEQITHIGPYAQDFYTQFKVGDDTTISTIDPAGVALVGIQALHENYISANEAIEALSAENQQLQDEIAALKVLVNGIQQDLTTCCAKTGVTNNTSGNFVLGQNTPNPFSGATKIPYYIPGNGFTAKLVIAEVATGRIILEEEIDCLSNSYEIPAGKLIAGTYTYSLVVNGNWIDTRIMVMQQ